MKVLIVDDDVVSRTIVHKLLAKERAADIVEAASAEAALAQLEAGFLPDLVISDFLMPGADGESFLNRLRSDVRWKGVHVLFCSSATNRDTIARIARLGIDGYLLKPIAAQKLREEYRRLAKDYEGSWVLEDADAVIKRTGLPSVDYLELLALFDQETVRLVAALRAAEQAGDRSLFVATLRSLCGSAANLGAAALIRSAERALTLLGEDGQLSMGFLVEPVAFECRRLSTEIAARHSAARDKLPAPGEDAATKAELPAEVAA